MGSNAVRILSYRISVTFSGRCSSLEFILLVGFKFGLWPSCFGFAYNRSACVGFLTHSRNMHVRLTEDSKLVLDVNVGVQGAPHFSP